MRYFTIGQLAKASQVGIETLRFYERRGLLPSPPRSASGYRHFSEDTIHRLHFIRRAKELGFSLKEVAELLALHDQEHSDRAQVKTITAAKLAEIERKIHDLQRIRAMLSQLLTECSGEG
jgi:MerR family mercuric resistance operon transcriptional regulator